MTHASAFRKHGSIKTFDRESLLPRHMAFVPDIAKGIGDDASTYALTHISPSLVVPSGQTGTVDVKTDGRETSLGHIDQSARDNVRVVACL